MPRGGGSNFGVLTHANYAANYDRLVNAKNEYDAGNLMRLSANIEPTV